MPSQLRKDSTPTSSSPLDPVSCLARTLAVSLSQPRTPLLALGKARRSQRITPRTRPVYGTPLPLCNQLLTRSLPSLPINCIVFAFGLLPVVVASNSGFCEDASGERREHPGCFPSYVAGGTTEVEEDSFQGRENEIARSGYHFRSGASYSRESLQRELGVEMGKGTKNNSEKKQLDTITANHHVKRDRERDRATALKPLSLLTRTRLYVQVGSPPRPAA